MSFISNNLFVRRARLSGGLFPSNPLFSGLLGFALLMPATYFMLTLLLRICFGAGSLYYSIAPSFLQSPSAFFSLHKAQAILGGALLAMLLNLLTVVRIHLRRGRRGPELQLSYRPYWLNTAIVVQGLLLFLVLVCYTLIQHIRY